MRNVVSALDFASSMPQTADDINKSLALVARRLSTKQHAMANTFTRVLIKGIHCYDSVQKVGGCVNVALTAYSTIFTIKSI